MMQAFRVSLGQVGMAMLFAVAIPAQEARAPKSESLVMIGEWQLNLARSHYGAGASRRRREVMSCSETNGGVRCTIRSVHADGRTAVGRFTARMDGTSAPVIGMQGMDSVRLRRISDSVADATFSARGKPILGYRMIRSEDGSSLIVMSVEPVTRQALTSVIVYDRAGRR